MRKQKTYAQLQYEKAYAIVREMETRDAGGAHWEYLVNTLENEIEQTYAGNAVRTKRMRLSRPDGGIAFWADMHSREVHEKGRIILGQKIRKHVNNYFLPF
jgi:hypothetical protein